MSRVQSDDSDDSDGDLQQRNQVTGPGQPRPGSPAPLTLSTDSDRSSDNCAI